MRIGVAVGIVEGGLLGGVLACGPNVELSHRHLAEEYCRERIDFLSHCSGGGRWSEELKERERNKCVADEAWDWTDECGDLKWTYLQCLLTIPCEKWPAHANDTSENRYCYAESRAFYGGQCRYTEDHGG